MTLRNTFQTVLEGAVAERHLVNADKSRASVEEPSIPICAGMAAPPRESPDGMN